MKKIFNWTLGSFFRTLGRIFAFLVLGFLVAYIVNSNDLIHKLNFDWLFMNVKASTLTSYGTYTGNSNDFNTCGSSGSYSYALSTSNSQGQYYWTRGNIGTTITGQAYAMSFLFKSGLTAQKTYDVVITMNKADFTNRLTANRINLFNGSSCDNMYNNDISLISFTNNATSSSNTSTIKFRIYANSIISWWGFTLNGDNKNITSVNNFGVKSITLAEVDTTGNNQVIENNNNNTNNIINNQNQTTQEIIENQNQNNQAIQDNLNDKLGNICSNIFDINSSTKTNGSNVTSNIQDNVLTVNSSQSWGYVSYNFNVETNTTYYIKYNVNHGNDINSNISITGGSLWGDEFNINNGSFNTGNNNVIYLKFFGTGNTSSNTAYYSNIMISKENKTFCVFGSYSSKLDDTNNAINNLSDTLTDDNISESTNEASNFFNNFNTDTHGLTGIITAPLNSIQSLTSKSCNNLVLPIPFLNNKNLTLPCMRDIYDDFFGDFMDIYDVITLGIVSYWIMVRIFNLVKDFKNPDHDEIEVMDL